MHLMRVPLLGRTRQFGRNTSTLQVAFLVQSCPPLWLPACRAGRCPGEGDRGAGGPDRHPGRCSTSLLWLDAVLHQLMYGLQQAFAWMHAWGITSDQCY